MVRVVKTKAMYCHLRPPVPPVGFSLNQEDAHSAPV